MKKYIKWIWSLWRQRKGYLALLLFLTVVSGSVAMIYPLVIGHIVNALQKAGADLSPKNVDLSKFLGILALIAFGRLISGSYPAVRAYMNLLMECDIRNKIFKKILDKDYNFLAKFRTGDIITRLTDDIVEYPKVSWFLCSGIFRALESSTKLILATGAMFYMNWKLAAISLTPLPIMVYVFFKIRKVLSRVYDNQQKSVSDVNDILEAAFSGIKIVKSFNAEKGQAGKFREILQSRIGIQLKLAKLHMLVHSVDRFAVRVGQVVVIGVGGYMVLMGTLSLGTIYSFYIYLEMMNFVVMDLPMLLVGARESFVWIDRLEEMNNYPVLVDTNRKGKDLKSVESIEFKNVSFQYETGAGVNNLSFHINKGSKIAMIGSVGCGKSILLKVMAGLLPVQSGEILINGINVNEYASESFLSKIGYVPQESLLVSESINDNVNFARNIGKDKIEEALRISQMTGEIRCMPDGLNTVLGSKGSLISGGQRQRVAIARALAGNPDLILFDDATASLDAHKEEDFWKIYNKKYDDKITVIISHRLKTIWMADYVFTLDNGRIVDSGTHQELASRCAIYNSFLDTLKHVEAIES